LIILVTAVDNHSYSKELNDRILYTERQFIGIGLPERPYYRHVLQAPGLYQGYAPQVLPGISQAIRAQNQRVAQVQTELTAHVIIRAATFLQTGST